MPRAAWQPGSDYTDATVSVYVSVVVPSGAVTTMVITLPLATVIVADVPGRTRLPLTVILFTLLDEGIGA